MLFKGCFVFLAWLVVSTDAMHLNQPTADLHRPFDNIVVLKLQSTGSSFLDGLMQGQPEVSRWQKEINHHANPFNPKCFAEYYQHKPGDGIIGASINPNGGEFYNFEGPKGQEFLKRFPPRTLLLQLRRDPFEKAVSEMRYKAIGVKKGYRHTTKGENLDEADMVVDLNATALRMTVDIFNNDVERVTELADRLVTEYPGKFSKAVIHYHDMARCQGLPRETVALLGAKDPKDRCNQSGVSYVTKPFHKMVSNIEELKAAFKGTEWANRFDDPSLRFTKKGEHGRFYEITANRFADDADSTGVRTMHLRGEGKDPAKNENNYEDIPCWFAGDSDMDEQRVEHKAKVEARRAQK